LIVEKNKKRFILACIDCRKKQETFYISLHCRL